MLGKFIGGRGITPSGGTASIQYVIVGGGGGGGGRTYSVANPDWDGAAGGGGGGQVLHDLSTGQDITIGTSYNIGVGIGGKGQNGQGVNGGDSWALGLTAQGGGRGDGTFSSCSDHDGAGEDNTPGGGAAGNTGTGTPLGATGLYYGGNGYCSTTYSARAGGGGAGAGGTGADASSSSGGAGGPGVGLNYKGVTGYFGGGGGGAGFTPGAGGTGGGAAGSNDGTPNAGTVNTGGGGGGVRQETNASYTGGTGGSGLVVLKYPTSFSAVFSGNVTAGLTAYNGYNILEITAGTGTVTFYRAL